MSTPNLIAVFRKMPKELFRVNNGRQVKLRTWTPKRHVYDIFVKNGRVEPKALDPSTYAAPNGASMRPNSPYQQSLVNWRFRGDDMVVYSVPEDLDAKITQFMMTNARAFTTDQWLEAYPEATEESNFPNTERGQSRGKTQQR
ncbi:hypothetical protein QBC33DRAFT_104855 [Phialemonium atrogriseum]|uniref:Tse2 ADP-ribosyltransferase toxin domain-containing protein n=1 Tax=Phialemonium atrogriseum TaxID=1093897 RepID=A0AAJ0C000_9PEZI|nr:uncharacterized protein QBC33DRAFT_104855 [Phialemonium atrogriseum]KAK1766563.1 hypothetical protein QBC33DRAFT_104855 [Phialemonium atrogriseum]